MKLKLKILKESIQGLYDHLGLPKGTIDLFLKHFVQVGPDVYKKRFDLFSTMFGSQIESLTDSDIPRTSSRGYQSSLQKVQAQLYAGTSHWYNQVFGEDIAMKVIEDKVAMYVDELKEGLMRINYVNITPEEFNKLPPEDMNLIFEKHFFDDYLEGFFNDHVKSSAMGTTGYIDNPGVGTGLYGGMKDWYMSTGGEPFFRQKMKEMMAKLPQRPPKEEA